MPDDPDIEIEEGRAEILKDMDATLRRMLETPPKPHKAMRGKNLPPARRQPKKGKR
jgi:hypothetical protein